MNNKMTSNNVSTCTIDFCTDHTQDANGTTTHTVELPGGSIYPVTTDASNNIVRDNRPWQWQPDRGA